MRSFVVKVLPAVLCLMLIPAVAQASLPKMSQHDANHYASDGLVSEFPYATGDYRRLDCDKRINRVKFECDVSFFAGDSASSGTIVVRHILKAGNRLGYRYVIRVVTTDTYCLDVLDKPPSECTDKVTKKGNGYA